MGVFVDLTGQRFGKLTVLGRSDKKWKDGKLRWLCRCDCGNERLVAGTHLATGHTTSCGCVKYTRRIEGERFGRLTVLRLERVGNRHMWLCQCDCGNLKHIPTALLHHRVGSVKSCGCLRKEMNEGWALSKKEEIGAVYGRWTIIGNGGHGKGKNNKGHRWLCRCECGTIREVKGSSLRTGHSQSCGCLTTDMLRIMVKGKPSKKRGAERRLNRNGYVLIWVPNNDGTDGSRCIFEHVHVMSKHIGRPLMKGETVHHKNGIRSDNRIENLELWASHHPPGQRTSDLVDFAKEILSLYEPQSLAIPTILEEHQTCL